MSTKRIIIRMALFSVYIHILGMQAATKQCLYIQ